MFPLYDHTRRQICMAAFLGLCVLPTLTVAAWGIARRLPWHKQAEEQRLGQELGLEVSIDSMKHTLPGVVRYAGLKLTDPETGQELFRCARTDRHVDLDDRLARADPPGNRAGGHAGRIGRPRLGAAAMKCCAAGWSARAAGRRSKSASPPTSGRCTTATSRRFSRSSKDGHRTDAQRHPGPIGVPACRESIPRSPCGCGSYATARSRRLPTALRWTRAPTPSPAACWPPASRS